MQQIYSEYSKNLIGSLLSFGGDHTVFNYGFNKVIKFSLIELLGGKKGLKKIEVDYCISKKYFGNFILDVEFVQSVDKKYYAVLQTKIIGHFLTKKDLIIPKVAEQYIDIYKSYKNLINSKYPQIDLIGRGGVFKDCLTNIMVDSNNTLYIIDTTLFDFSDSKVVSWLLTPFILCACWINNRRIYSFYNFIDSNAKK